MKWTEQTKIKIPALPNQYVTKAGLASIEDK